MKRRFLIVTADDFGLDEAINDAVQRAAAAGVLTAASLMVGAPATADAVRRAHQLPNLRVGLHVVLADGWAVLPRQMIPALVDRNGRFRNRLFVDAVRYFALPWVRKQLNAEIRAQFQSFAQTGLALDHVNAHKHFHVHPGLFDMIVRIGREFGVGAVRVPYEPLWFSMRRGGIAAPLEAALLAPWLMRMKRRLRAAAMTFNDQIFGIACSGSVDEGTMLDILRNLPAGATEIYLHPATREASPVGSPVACREAGELAALLSPRVRAAISATDAACGGYTDLMNSRM